MKLSIHDCLSRARLMRGLAMALNAVFCLIVCSIIVHQSLEKARNGVLQNEDPIIGQKPSRFTDFEHISSNESQLWIKLIEWLNEASPASGNCDIFQNVAKGNAAYVVQCDGLISSGAQARPPINWSEQKNILARALAPSTPAKAKTNQSEPISNEPYGHFVLGEKPYQFDEAIDGWKALP